MPIVPRRIGMGVVAIDEDAKRTYYVRECDYPDWKYVADRINPRIGELVMSKTVQLNRAMCGSAKSGDDIFVACHLLYPV
ncbi:unnamed protein product [marine sediment metagenome]|uniref:Uncharacterized protein n=1 Tax=marine sediment metagenome TaxID=412755 RepID=X1L9Z6_9ZZZZ